MIDGDNTQSWLTLDLYWYSWLIEGSRNGVDWNWVVWVGGVGRNVANDAELTVLGGQALQVDEVRDLGGKVYAVDEDIALNNLREWSSLGSLSHIPLENVLSWNASAKTEVHSTASTSSQSTNDKHAWSLASLSRSLSDALLNISDQEALVLVMRDTWVWLGGWVSELP